MLLYVNSYECLGISNKATKYTINGNFACVQEIMVDKNQI